MSFDDIYKILFPENTKHCATACGLVLLVTNGIIYAKCRKFTCDSFFQYYLPISIMVLCGLNAWYTFYGFGAQKWANFFEHDNDFFSLSIIVLFLTSAAYMGYGHSILIRPRLAKTYHNRGNAYYYKGSYNRAIAYFDKVLEIDPEFTEAYNNRGNAYAQGKGEIDRAISDYNRALEIDPRSAKAYYNRGLAYYYKKEYDKAWEDVQSVQSLGGQVHPGFLKALCEASGRQR